MRGAVVLLVLMTVVASACTATTETRALSLAEELENVSPGVNNSVAELFDALDQPYDNTEQLYERLLDLKLPTSFAILLDKAQRVEAPPGTGAELDRYEDFIGELLFASESLDLAIATENPAAIAIAAVVIEVAAGALAVVLPATSCEMLTPEIGRDLCDPGGLDGYEAGLGFELRRFVASFRPVLRMPDTFGDMIRGSALATLQADAARVLDATGTRVGALDPGTTYARVHEALLDYFPAAVAAWAEHEPSIDSSDSLIYRDVVNSLEEERMATQQLLAEQHESILAEVPGSQIRSITNVWFAPIPSPDGQ